MNPQQMFGVLLLVVYTLGLVMFWINFGRPSNEIAYLVFSTVIVFPIVLVSAGILIAGVK
jgi:hypothetical protein